jgi:hypothetical protein
MSAYGLYDQYTERRRQRTKENDQSAQRVDHGDRNLMARGITTNASYKPT